jgi:hypothetical protein
MLRQIIIRFLVISFSVWIISATDALDNPKIYSKDNVLAAGDYNNQPASSDLTLIIKIVAGGKTVMDEGSDLVYILPQNDIKGWNELNFDDSGWTVGKSSVGYSDNDDNTTIQGPIPSIYTRYRFDIPNANSVKELELLLDYDDAYILWLNGVEIARTPVLNNIAPGGVPGWNETMNKITDHEATILPAGKPNADRWKKPVGWAHNQLGQHVIQVDFGGASAMLVEPAGKLAVTWGNVKLIR